MMPEVVVVESDENLKSLLASHEEQLVIIMFHASWCGPCGKITPVLTQLSVDYPDVLFVTVNVDDLPETTQASGIRGMPTFQFFKSNEKIAELLGANADLLNKAVQELSLEEEKEPAAPESDSPDVQKVEEDAS